MKISVIVPTYNRGKIILNTLKALSKQTLTDNEMGVIVVDEGSTDDSTGIINNWISSCQPKNFHFISLGKNRGNSLAFNTGMWAAISRYLLYIDDNCLPNIDWAEHHLCRQQT